MKGYWFGILFLFLLDSHLSKGQSTAVIKFNQLENTLNRQDDTLRIINFWATWCAPCVKELPYFEKARRTHADEKVKILLVSLDYRDALESKLKPFISRQHIRSSVVLLDEPDYNTWIDKVAPEWSGALPMTLVVKKSQNIRKFFEKPLKKGELESIIQLYNL